MYPELEYPRTECLICLDVIEENHLFGRLINARVGHMIVCASCYQTYNPRSHLHEDVVAWNDFIRRSDD